MKNLEEALQDYISLLYKYCWRFPLPKITCQPYASRQLYDPSSMELSPNVVSLTIEDFDPLIVNFLIALFTGSSAIKYQRKEKSL